MNTFDPVASGKVMLRSFPSPRARSWSRWLVLIGLFGMLIGVLDPLEGSLVILPSIALAALGAYLGQSRRRALLFWALALAIVGVGAMWGLTAIGGIGGTTGRSVWWILLLAPYAVGYLLGVIGAILALFDAFKRTA